MLLHLRQLKSNACVVEELSGTWELALLSPDQAGDPVSLAGCPVQWLPADVPGTAMSALFAAGRADFDHLPQLDAQDIWYRCSFAAAGAERSSRKLLVLEGLATLAEVWLNGVHLLHTDNMFLAHEVEVGEVLQDRNELVIRFAALHKVLETRRPRPRWRTRLVQQQQLRWIRTSLLGRIPGWTPAVPAIGPWRPITLQHRRQFEWESVQFENTLDGNTGALKATLHLRALAPDFQIRSAFLRVGEISAELEVRPDPNGLWRIEGETLIHDVRRWWPHTHGDAVLYPVALSVNTPTATFEIACGRTGFRRIELISEGDGFALNINDVQTFCRGACWTPTDILTLTSDAFTTRKALELAKDAGMNMLRIGGTMFYEADHFYALCDELGILLWHDWMFANMDYPADDSAFVASVEMEARQFLQRVQLSPSLALLCGNSEVEQQAAMLGLERPFWRNRLFSEILPGIGKTLRPDVPYWPSSPSGGVLPFQVDSGAAHYFGVGAYLQPLTDARRCAVRFASECLAFSHVPEPATVERIVSQGQSPVHDPVWKARVPRDSGAGWDFEDVRDHYLAELFRVDPVRLRSENMERYLALSRVVTGELMAYVFAEWRRKGSTCAGGIVWFFRDLWPGAGWGVVDAFGRPKAVWHYLRRTMSPVALFTTDEGLNGLALHAVNETAAPVSARLSLTLYRNGEQVIAEGAQDLAVPAHGSVEVRGDALLGSFFDTTYRYRFGPPGHNLAHAVLQDAVTGEALSSAFFFPQGHAFAVEDDLGLAATALLLADGAYRVTVCSRRFAQAVHIEADGYEASHNYFHLQPGGMQELRLSPSRDGARLHGFARALNSSRVVAVTPVPELVDT